MKIPSTLPASMPRAYLCLTKLRGRSSSTPRFLSGRSEVRPVGSSRPRTEGAEMSTRWKIVGAAVAAGLVLVIGTGVAVAASGERGGKALAGERGPMTAVASYLGLTVAQLREALHDDKSLAQIAGEQGKSVDGLKQAIRADAEQKLSQAVTNGRI